MNSAQKPHPPGSLKHAGPNASLSEVSTRDLLITALERITNGALTNPEVDVAGRLELALGRVTDKHWNRFSRQRLVDQFRDLRSLQFNPVGKTVVELGCGGINPLSRVFVYYLLGAEKCYALDLDTVHDESWAASALVSAGNWVLMQPNVFGGSVEDRNRVQENLSRVDIDRLSAGNLNGLEELGIHLVHADFMSKAIPANSADLVFSTSFLEHIPDVRRGLEAIEEMTSLGGVGFHAIDGYDHRSYNGKVGPLDFLSIESDDHIVFGCNRVRPKQFRSLFEQSGLEVIKEQLLSPINDEQIPKKLAPAFQELSAEELKYGRCRIYTKKPND